MKFAMISAAGLGAALLGFTGPAAGAEPAPAAAASEASKAAPSANEMIEPEALQALTRMGAYLRSLTSFTMTSENSVDVEVDGQLITLDGAAVYKARAPNALYIETSSDRKIRQVFYDGRKVTIYSPRMKLYASIDAPPTIRETLEMASTKYGVVLPLTDLFYWGTPAARTDELITATYIGPARCGDAACDHYAFQETDLDWQIWIEQGDRPVPRKVVITTLFENSQPRFSARLDWTLNPELSDATFAFSPPSDSQAIPIATVGQ